MSTPQLALGIALLITQLALLITAIYLLTKAHRQERAALHTSTPAAYWKQRAHVTDTRNLALLCIIGTLAMATIARFILP